MGVCFSLIVNGVGGEREFMGGRGLFYLRPEYMFFFLFFSFFLRREMDKVD